MKKRISGICCDCGYGEEAESECLEREDRTHCVHWWDGPDEHTEMKHKHSSLKVLTLIFSKIRERDISLSLELEGKFEELRKVIEEEKKQIIDSYKYDYH